MKVVSLREYNNNATTLACGAACTNSTALLCKCYEIFKLLVLCVV